MSNVRQPVITITLIMFFVSLIGVFLCFLWGKAHKKVKLYSSAALLFTSVFIGVICTIATGFIHMGCEYINFCAPLDEMNIFHIALPIIAFPVFWLAIFLGHAARRTQ